MISILLGLIFFMISLYMILPIDWGLGWTEEFLFVLQGSVPLVFMSLGFFFVIISIADIYDSHSAKKQEERMKVQLQQKEMEWQDT